MAGKRWKMIREARTKDEKDESKNVKNSKTEVSIEPYYVI